MGEFFRKLEPTTDLVLSSLYADLYDGKSTLAKIGGGKEEQAYLARFALPNLPKFGAGELERLDYNFYVNDISLSPSVFAFPELSVFKTKDSKRISISEGMQSVNETRTKDVLMFSSHLSGMASIDENFSGTNQAYGDAENYIAIQRNLIREKQLYLTPEGVRTYGRQIVSKWWARGDFDEGDDTSLALIKKNYGYTAESVGITNLAATTIVCPVRKAQKWTEKYGYEINPKPGNADSKNIYIRHRDLYQVQAGSRSEIPNNDTYGDEMTPSNTIFEISRGAAEFHGEQTKGESGVELLGAGAMRLSTAAKLTGGQSGEMYTFWKDEGLDSAGDPIRTVSYPALGTFNSNQYWGGAGYNTVAVVAGATDRQEVMFCKKNIPFPMKHPAKPHKRGHELTADGQDSNDFANNIEMDVQIKSLPMAYTVTGTPQGNPDNGAGGMSGGNSKQIYHTLRRAFVICFSEDAPKRNQSLFEFVHAHSDKGVTDQYQFLEQNTGTAANSGEGKTASVVVVDDVAGTDARRVNIMRDVSHVCNYGRNLHHSNTTEFVSSEGNSAKGAKSFAAIAFIRTPDGVVAVPAAFYKPATGVGTLGEVDYGWYLDETNKDIWIDAIAVDGENKGSSFIGEWIRMNFLFGPQAYGVERNSNPNASNLSWQDTNAGTHCRLLMSDIADGTLMENYATYSGLVPPATDYEAFWELNNIINDFSTKEFKYWPKHMSVWLTNYKADYSAGSNNANERDLSIAPASGNSTITGTNMHGQVFIDKLEFKDFNYDIDNPNMNDRNSNPDAINIVASENTFIGPSYKSGATTGVNTDIATDKISSYQSNSPNMLAFGTTVPRYLGYMHPARNRSGVSEDHRSYHPWTSDETAWIMLHDFQTSNLANVREINDVCMIATMAVAGGDRTIDDGTSIIPRWGSVHSTDYGTCGWINTDVGNTPAYGDMASLTINNAEGEADVGTSSIKQFHPPGSCIGLKYVWTGYLNESDSNKLDDEDVSGVLMPYLVTTASSGSEENDSPMGSKQRMHFSIRPGDLLVTSTKPESDIFNDRGVDKHIVSEVAFSNTGSVYSSNFLVNLETAMQEDIPTTPTRMPIFIQPDGMCDNFSKKGLIMLNPNPTGQSSGGQDKYWAKRECGSASARITDITEVTSNSITMKVDTIAPLLLDIGEQYMVYLYGEAYDDGDFVENTDYDSLSQEFISTSGVSKLKPYAGSSDVNTAKAGLYIAEIDKTNKLITLDWDGLAEDASTRLITEANLPILMISPYRYWIHLNVECSYIPEDEITVDQVQTRGTKYGVLPSRSYNSFTVMNHNFPYWGGLYHTGTVNEPVDDEEVSITLTSTTGIEVGDSIMISNSLGQDEVMYVRGVASSTVIHVIRGASGTFVGNLGNINASVTPDALERDGHVHGSGFVAATATFTFSDTDFDSDDEETITLADGTNAARTYKIMTGYDADETAQEFNAGASATAAAANFKAIVESSNGHDGQIVVVVSAGAVTMTQATTGTVGNTNISHSSGWNGICEVNVAGLFQGGAANAPVSPYNKIKKITIHAASGEELSGNPNRVRTAGSTSDLNTVAKRRNLGSTFNEYLYNQDTSGGVPGAYINTWLPTVVGEGSIFDVETDWGLGAYDIETDSGGDLDRQIIKAGEYNLMKLYGIKNSSDFVVGGQIDLLLRYKDDSVPHITHISTKDSPTNKPFALAVFKDALPLKPILKVKPNDEDPNLPTFTWEVSDADLWYGLLYIDSGQIDSQYTNMVYHIPLNEEIVDDAYGNVYLENKGGTKVAAGAGTFTMSYDGLSGFSKDFDGVLDYLKFTPPTTDPTSEMTIVTHITPDAAPSSGVSMILQSWVASTVYNDYEIYLDTNSRVNFKAFTGDSTTEIELQSSVITIDGETPTCVIVTFDKELKSGNSKLFINGKLEDQTGLILATSTVNNWKNNQNINATATSVYVGCGFQDSQDASSATAESFFDGKIEEIVCYNKCLYPVVPSDVGFTLAKPLREIYNGSPISYNAKLFIKDYHNIRGASSQEVAASAPVSYRKASFRLVD